MEMSYLIIKTSITNVGNLECRTIDSSTKEREDDDDDLLQ